MTQTDIAIPQPELVDTSKLKTHPEHKNPNVMDRATLDRLKTSIKKYGFIVPIVTNKDYIIADGEQRWIAANELAMKQVLIVRVPLEEVDRLLIQQILNVSAMRGVHDLLLDAQAFENIIDLGKKDDLKYLLDLTDKDLAKYLDELHPAQEDEFNTPELESVQTEIEQGTIFQLGKHRLMCGDSTNISHQAKLLEEIKPDLLLTDPPYGISIVSSQNSVGISAPVSFGKVGTKGLVDAPVYAPVYADDKPFNPQHLVGRATTTLIFGANHFAHELPNQSHWLVWDKKAGIGADNNFFSDAELIWTNVNKKSCTIYRYLWSGLLRSGNRKAEMDKRVHPTQKPVGLLANIIQDYSQPNQTVLDLYGGSGSTLIACEQTGRTCYMMEIDPRYCEIIAQRWEKYTGQKRKLVKSGKIDIR